MKACDWVMVLMLSLLIPPIAIVVWVAAVGMVLEVLAWRRQKKTPEP